ncbi:MAG TPA: hypothetical protein PKD26_11200 [Pyrinomonadaceae bacterium]|nr:hypothetical protein [Pyrinomonadaceae bacterium]
MRSIDDNPVIFINEEFVGSKVDPFGLDRLLAEGWRHFGPRFFRYSLALYGNDIRRVVPLRIRLSKFRRSRSQAKVVKKNIDVELAVERSAVTDEVEELFSIHRNRFRRHRPDSIYTFIAPNAAAEPCEVRQMSIRKNGKLIAASFFDVGNSSSSGIYAVFDPAESARSLGIFTQLAEIELAAVEGKEFYYLGYCYNGSSFYDYKKQFYGIEAYDWEGNWHPIERNAEL